MARVFLVVHLGAGTRQPLRVGLGIDRFGERGRAAARPRSMPVALSRSAIRC